MIIGEPHLNTKPPIDKATEGARKVKELVSSVNSGVSTTWDAVQYR
jgi:hypothetical protein